MTAQDVDQFIDYLCQIGKRCVVHFRLRPSVADPDDEMVLEAAVNGRADAIVTFNLRDFGAAVEQFGIAVLSPGEAVGRLENRS